MSETKEVVQFPAAVLECPICLEQFKDPRMLPACFHTLCYKCLKDLMETSQEGGHFNCPVCRGSLQIPSDGAESFPKNFFMNNCLSVAARSPYKTESNPSGAAAKPENRCGNAEERGDCTAAEKFCTDCNEYYCHACSEAHQRVKTSRGHTQIQIDGLTDEILQEIAQKAAAPNCPKHKDEKLKLYCKTCQHTVCYLCSQVSHKLHEFQDISDVDDEFKAELEKAKAKVVSLADNTREGLRETQQSQQQFENGIQMARETARDAFNKLQEMLKQKANEVDKSLEGKGEMHRPKFEAKLKNYQLDLQKMESLSLYVEDLLCKGTAYNRLATLPDVRNQLRQVQSLETSPDVSSFPSPAMLATEAIRGEVFELETPLSVDDTSGSFLLTTTLQQKDEVIKIQSSSVELSRTSLTLGAKTRQYHFGEILSGSLKEEVSIKKSTNTKDSREQLLTEANTLQALRHRRILSLIGVCTTSEPLYIVTESLKRSLLAHLKEDKGKTLQLGHMTNMAAQIAEGMAYLEVKRYAHRNLSAENILVGDNNCVKVAGFSRAIKLNEKGNQVTETTFRTKWTSPEALFEHKFSAKSDVWSFGILLYEMITCGQEPYPGMDNKTTRKEVMRGYRMPRPDSSPVPCPKELYDIMVTTWLTPPEQRPTFEYLTTVFENFVIATENQFQNVPD